MEFINDDDETLRLNELDKALENDKGSLRNSPIPTINDIRGFLSEKDKKEIETYINSGKISKVNVDKITDYAKKGLELYLKKNPHHRDDEDIKKDMLSRLFRAALNMGKPKGGRRRKRKTSVPKRYVPTQLSKKDKKRQARELKKSRREYKNKKYHTRKKMKSFKSKVSPHIIKARKMYKIDKIRPSRKLARASKCKLKGLKKMFQKGQGAYFSSGSRPNQTGHSWGYARMASAITGGKASAVDFKIIQENCSKKSRAYKLAKKAYKKYKKGTRRVKQVKIGGRRKKKKRRRTKKKRK